jgi:hypothetical protein
LKMSANSGPVQFTLKAMCFNLLKAANKICLMDESVGAVRP